MSLAPGQVSGGAFRGEVRDASQAVVEHAKVEIRSRDNGMRTIAESNRDGLYVSPNLIPGSYLLSVARQGFETEVFGPVVLDVNQTVRVDFALKPGNVSESIEVKAAPEQLLATENAQMSQVIGAKQVAEMPLNGRSWQQLIALDAGVNPGAPGESGSPNPVNVNGQRTKANLFLVDGVSVTSSEQGRGNGFNMPLDAIGEFSVQSGAYSAEFGDVAGGVINLQSKSGGNQWHGGLFEFFRNDAMDAANFFSNATGQPRNPLRYNQFGGSAGGPIRRDKTFVFADYQGTLAHSAVPLLTSLPSSDQRSGNFSGLTAGGAVVPIYDPGAASVIRAPFPNNTIPASRIDPAAAAITALLPQPNQFDNNGQPLPFNNYAVTRTSTSSAHSFDIRVDHQFSAGNTIFVRHSFQNSDAVLPSLFGLPLGGPPSLDGTSLARNQNTSVGHIHQFNGDLFHELRIGFNRQTSSLTQEDYGQNLSQKFGIPGINQSPETSGLSSLNITGLFSVGGSILTPLRLATTGWNFSEKLTWAKGRHLVHFGFDYQYEMGSSGYLVYGRGYYTFLNLSTSSAVGTPGGNAFASFLVGAPFQVLRDEFPPGLVGMISSRYGFYAQDDVKLTPRLTLNLGARYDIMPYAREMHDRLSNFDPATGTLLLAGVNTNPRLVNTDYKDLAPRIGLAWAPGGDSRTVIRAGYGIGFVDPVGSAGVLNSNQFNIPFYLVSSITQFPYTAPAYTLSGALPGLVMPPVTAPTGNQRYIVPTDGNQYSQTWSLGIQRALTASSIFEIAYVGTSGNRLLTASNINAGAPGATNPVTRRPFGSALAEVRELSNSAHSTYQSLQVKAERRFSRGLFFLASWTWSKSIDDQSNGTDNSAASGQYPQNPANPSLDRGLSSFDRTHRVVASAVWEIPYLRTNAFGDGVLKGWQLSGILTAETGSPFSVLMNCADVNAEGNNCRPNLVQSPVLPSGQQSIARWFDTSAFAIPNPQAYGNAGRNILRAPGLTDIDLALARSFRWRADETRRLAIRGEFFNVLNHTNFGLPVNSIDSPALGSIASAGPGRVIQLGARLEF
ncbi:MAG TPA: TonB-dependent receptor [Bryobacteraceae bacterium]|nr:TonB-dependent receptor [Bryobacteraceae bacterium]